MKSKATATIIFAEDLRAELSGKFSIIGTIVGNLRVMVNEPQNVPAINLAVYAEVEGIKSPKKIIVRIQSPDGSTITEGNMPAPSGDTIFKGFIVGGKFQNVIINTEGVYTVSILIDDQEFSKTLDISYQKQT